MKGYLLINTGEVRKAKEGEYYLDSLGSFMHRAFCGETDCEYPILALKEFEIPDEATALFVAPMKDNLFMGGEKIFPIPRPKKVKKWQFVTINQDHLGRKRAEVSGWITDEEADVRGIDTSMFKVFETEIEAEE